MSKFLSKLGPKTMTPYTFNKISVTLLILNRKKFTISFHDITLIEGSEGQDISWIKGTVDPHHEGEGWAWVGTSSHTMASFDHVEL